MQKPLAYLSVLVLFLISTKSFSQAIDDWEFRPTLFIKHKLKNGFALEGKYEHRLDQNFSHYKKSVLGVEAEYKIILNTTFSLKPTLDYRFNFGQNKFTHDFRYSFALGYHISPHFSLEYKPTFQQELSRGNHPNYYLRNEIELDYEIRKWSLSLFTENYQSIDKGLSFDTQKYGFRTEYQLDKSNALEFKIDVKHKSNNQNIARVMLGYIFIIP